jgi:hypothetical protein
VRAAKSALVEARRPNRRPACNPDGFYCQFEIQVNIGWATRAFAQQIAVHIA